MSDAPNPTGYHVSYRLTLLQVLFLPTGALAATVLSGTACCYGIYYTRRVSHTAFWPTAIASAVFLLSFAVLLYSYRRWLRAPIRLRLTKTGVEGVGPYQLVTVHGGLMGTSIIKSITGHFVVVPAEVLSRSELQYLLKANGSGTDRPKKAVDSSAFAHGCLFFFTLGLILLLCLFGPFLVGRYWGHGPGIAAATAAVAAWVYLRCKVKMTPMNTIIWLILLVYLAGVVAFEALPLFNKSPA